MTTSSSTTGSGNRPSVPVSSLHEDRLAPKPTLRQQVDVAASTLLAFIPRLPEHKAEDSTPEMEATSHRLTQLRNLLNDHFEVD